MPNSNPSGLGMMNFKHRFPGQYRDPETGLYQNWNRDYDSVLGRYIQSDPLGLDAGTNTYLYVRANPVNKVDFMGKYDGDISDGNYQCSIPFSFSSDPFPHSFLCSFGQCLGFYPSSVLLTGLVGYSNGEVRTDNTLVIDSRTTCGRLETPNKCSRAEYGACLLEQMQNQSGSPYSLGGSDSNPPSKVCTDAAAVAKSTCSAKCAIK